MEGDDERVDLVHEDYNDVPDDLFGDTVVSQPNFFQSHLSNLPTNVRKERLHSLAFNEHAPEAEDADGDSEISSAEEIGSDDWRNKPVAEYV